MTKDIVTDPRGKIKRFLTTHEETFGIVFFMICVGIGSFFFGRAYGQQESVSIIGNTQEITQETVVSTPNLTDLQKASQTPTKSQETGDGAYVASHSGTKYYPASGCGAVNRIKPENRVYFGTTEEAESAGYERYDGCK